MSSRIHFHYNLFGNPKAPVILFLHGFMGNGSEWQDCCQYLSDEFYGLTIDLPFHGKTVIEGNENEITFEQTASSIIRLLVNLNIQRCYLVGYSMGGRIALYLALNHPENFIRIVMESASPGLKTKQERNIRSETDARVTERLKSNNFNEFLIQWFKQPIFGDLIKQKYFNEILKRRLKEDPGKLAISLKKLGTGIQPSLWEKLSQLDLYCLLVVGEKDLKFMKIANEMSNLNNMISIKKIANCYHTIHLLKPDVFAGLLSDFFLSDSH